MALYCIHLATMISYPFMYSQVVSHRQTQVWRMEVKQQPFSQVIQIITYPLAHLIVVKQGLSLKQLLLPLISLLFQSVCACMCSSRMKKGPGFSRKPRPRRWKNKNRCLWLPASPCSPPLSTHLPYPCELPALGSGTRQQPHYACSSNPTTVEGQTPVIKPL